MDLEIYFFPSLTYQAKGFSTPCYQHCFLVVLQNTRAGTAGWLPAKRELSKVKAAHQGRHRLCWAEDCIINRIQIVSHPETSLLPVANLPQVPRNSSALPCLAG